jgi:iron complex outermembrane receptor protein
VAGFGDVPLSRAPFSATVITLGQVQDAGISGIGDLTRVDAGTTDAYNAPGYWGQLAVRGFTLDNRFNYRRDGLPINAETVIAQGNKQALEILKGTSGLQAGTSSPGGLVNLVVKRPTQRLRQAELAWEQAGSLGLSVDLADRGGADGALGWRLNAGLERLDPQLKSSQGHRGLLALATEARLGKGTLLELEVESSRQSQPSTPGFSLLGDVLPSARSIDPRTNLNNQPWSLPVVMQGRTASLRYTQTLSERLEFVAHGMVQRLQTDDRIAFPFGFLGFAGCLGNQNGALFVGFGPNLLGFFFPLGTEFTGFPLSLGPHTGKNGFAGFLGQIGPLNTHIHQLNARGLNFRVHIVTNTGHDGLALIRQNIRQGVATHDLSHG